MSWDERYSAEHYLYGTDPNSFLVENFTKFPKGKILCLAEGEGRNAVFLAQQGYNVTAVDSSAVGLAKAARLAQDQGVDVEFIHMDLNDFDLGSNKWDGIVSIFAHVPEPVRQKLLPRVVEGLKPGGVFLQEAYIPKQLEYNTGGPSMVSLMYSKEIMQTGLKGLTFERLQELERKIDEGTRHSGMAAVVQVIAIK